MLRAILPALVMATPAVAQTDPCARRMQLRFDSNRPELVRGAEELGAVRPHFLIGSATPVSVCADSAPVLQRWAAYDTARLRVDPLQLYVTYNSAYPRTRNDGLLWAGVGTSTQLSAGAEFRWKVVTVGLKPVFAWQQNGEFEFPRSAVAGQSEFSHPDHPGIDYPKRFGETSFNRIDAGGSFVRVDAGPISAALSQEVLRLGASDLYPIFMSGTAPGFWHIRAGTRNPVDLRWLKLDAQAFWGALEESNFYDGDGENDSHLFTGVVLSVEPSFVPGLRVGASRISHIATRPGGHSVGYYIKRLFDAPTFSTVEENLPENALGALFLSWTIPQGGFEVHAEWTREDRPFNLRDLLREPDWTQAYSLGFGKIFQNSAALTRFWGELVHLGEAATVRGGKGFFSYYTHGEIPQGHTHRGQMLGAPIGPGSDAQILGFDSFRARGSFGGSIERVRYDDDVYYRTFARRFGEARHDVELTGSVYASRRLGALNVQAGLTGSRRYDRDFLVIRTGGLEEQIETNWGLQLNLAWLPRGW